MKISPLIALITVGITCCATAGPGGGGGGGAAGGSASGSATGAAAPTSPATSQGTTPAAPPNTPATTSQQLNERNQFQTQTGITNSPFSPAISNQIVNTNEFGNNTNDNEEEEEEEREHRHHHHDHDTNEMSPMGGANGTDQFGNNFSFTDRAVTPTDQSLLVTLRQSVQTQLGVTPTGTMPVHFVIDNGVVTLLGTVPTSDESQRILLLAQQTTGVTQVVNRLRVNANANNNMTQTGTEQTGITGITGTQNSSIGGATSDHAFSASDKQLLFKVQQQATKETGLTPANGQQLPVHFSIQNGVVAITGQVASPQQKQLIAGAVQNVPGVVRVVDNITVSSQTPTPTTGTTTANPAVNNQLAPTSTGGQSNTMFQNSTNVSP